MPMRTLIVVVMGALAGACGGDDGSPCGNCGAGYVCDSTAGVCVPADAGTDGDTVDAPPDTPAETPAETDAPAETPGESLDDGRADVLGPCATAGGICRPLVSGCASCVEGEEPAPTTILCPPDNYCCMPRTVEPPYPACVDQGGVCYPSSSGSLCPVGWRREDVSCNGPAGCCLPGDTC
jgi:hypothetical protein